MTAEHTRLEESRHQKMPWKKWGPYLSERQWGTVREDYSEGGDAWHYFPHDQARSRAYRWGEDGLAGISDDHQRLCFALALWNGQDPTLKERLFGLTNSENNHGEDVKEYYFYLDSTPTHSYMKYLYKYPQATYPYANLVETSRRRSRNEFEYELLDTGVFEQNRYFDVFVEYAKASPEDLLSQIIIHNRGPEAAEVHVLPTLPDLRDEDIAGSAFAITGYTVHQALGGAWECFLAFAWHGPGAERLLVTVNYAPNQSPCYVRLPFTDLGNGQWQLQDLLGDATYDRQGRDLHARGLYLDEPPWQAAVFALPRREA